MDFRELNPACEGDHDDHTGHQSPHPAALRPRLVFFLEAQIAQSRCYYGTSEPKACHDMYAWSPRFRALFLNWKSVEILRIDENVQRGSLHRNSC